MDTHSPAGHSFFSTVNNVRNIWEMSKNQLYFLGGGCLLKQEKLGHGVAASKTRTTSLAAFFFFCGDNWQDAADYLRDTVSLLLKISQ